MNLNTAEVTKKLYQFLAFVHLKDSGRKLSFVDKNTFLGRTENYKSEIAERARNELKYEDWQESMIGSGEILACCQKAMACAGNLVYINQQYIFDNITNREHKAYSPNAERVLYDIYKAIDEEAAFTQALNVFGRRYDIIAYLFFIKDSSRFLPVSPGRFEASLASIGVEYKISHMCSWENYTGFIDIVRSVQRIMQDNLPDIDVRLIDAHSFLWVISYNSFRDLEASEDI